MDGKQYFATLFPFYGIELGDRQMGMFLHKKKEVFVSPPDPAFFIDFGMYPDFSFGVADLPGEVDIPSIEYIIINQAVNGTSADRDGIPVVC